MRCRNLFLFFSLEMLCIYAYIYIYIKLCPIFCGQLSVGGFVEFDKAIFMAIIKTVGFFSGSLTLLTTTIIIIFSSLYIYIYIYILSLKI